MLDRSQYEFLLKNNTINIVNQFLKEKGLTNLRICKPEAEDQKGKIVLLFNNPKNIDDFTLCKILHALHKLEGLDKSNPHRKDFVFESEESLKPLFKERMLKSAIPFTVNEINTLAKKMDEKFGVDLEEEDSDEADVLVFSLKIRVKRAFVDNTKELMNDVKRKATAAVEPHITNGHKRTLSQN